MYKWQIHTCKQQNIQHSAFIESVRFHVERETTYIVNPAIQCWICTLWWKKRVKNEIWHGTREKLWKEKRKLHQTCRKILFWSKRLLYVGLYLCFCERWVFDWLMLSLACDVWYSKMLHCVLYYYCHEPLNIFSHWNIFSQICHRLYFICLSYVYAVWIRRW